MSNGDFIAFSRRTSCHSLDQPKANRLMSRPLDITPDHSGFKFLVEFHNLKGMVILAKIDPRDGNRPLWNGRPSSVMPFRQYVKELVNAGPDGFTA